MKLVFEIKTKPITQVFIIVAVVTSSSGALALIATYSNSQPVCILGALILALAIYMALRLAPC
jgi:hypothetical protein